MSGFNDNLMAEVDQHNDANPYASWGRLDIETVREKMRAAAVKKLNSDR